MKVISIPKSAYQKLVKKAQLWDGILNLVKNEYPTEEYSEKRMKEFQRADNISPKLRKDILSFLKTKSV